MSRLSLPQYDTSTLLSHLLSISTTIRSSSRRFDIVQVISPVLLFYPLIGRSRLDVTETGHRFSLCIFQWSVNNLIFLTQIRDACHHVHLVIDSALKFSYLSL